jgi:pyruvate,water dikinase
MARDRSRLRLYTLLDVLAEGARVDDFGLLSVQLAEAQRKGAQVPDTWVVPALAFRMQVEERLPPGHDLSSLIRAIKKPSGIERAARAFERLQKEPLPDVLMDSIATQIGSSASGHLRAVASLGLKDPTTATLSGLDTDVLLQDAVEAVRTIWARSYLELSLRTLHDVGARDLAVAVMLQRLPGCNATLQVLTTRPESLPRLHAASSKLPAQRRWVAVAGLGPRLHVEQGALLADQIAVDAQGAVSCMVADKNASWATGGGADDARGARSAAISASGLEGLPGAVRSVVADEPVLLTYGVDSDEATWLTEIRHLVGGAYPGAGEPTTVWSRSGLDALLPRVPTPLTAGLVAQASEASLREAIAQLGGKMSRSSHLVESVYGRPYFDLSALLQVVSSVPGLDPTALLDLVRGASSDDVLSVLELRRKTPSLPALSLAAARLLTRQRRLLDAQTQFESRAGDQRKWLLEMDLAILPDDALKTTLRECFEFFRATAGLLLSSSLAFLSAFVAVRAVISRSFPAEASRLAHRVCSGAGKLETTVSAAALFQVAEILRSDDAACAALQNGAVALADVPEGPARRAVLQWLGAYGDRGWTEPEIAAARFGENPAQLLDMLRMHLGTDANVDSRMSRVRADADEAIAMLEESQSYLEATLFRSLLGRARGLLRVRERSRVWLAQTVSMLRTVVLDVDRRLRRLDSGLKPGAAFFLEPHELSQAIGAMRADLGSAVRWRRAGFALVSGRADPPELFVGRPPPFLALSPDQPITGEGASSAIGEGVVRHLSVSTGRGTLSPNSILVVRSLDVGLAPILPAAAGVIAECGGTLSHGAIAAREMGVPAVVGASGARAMFADGDRVRVDGNTGSIERL